MSLLKLPLLLLSLISYEVVFEYPTPPPADHKVVVTTITRERIWAHAGLPCNLFLKATLYLVTVAELLAALGVQLRLRDWLSNTDNTPGPTGASPLSPSFLVAASLIIVGGYIRYKCYRALGPLFTFEQCICKDHKLVTTGPYGVVRHPSYTGLLMNFVGTFIMHGNSHSWLRTSGFLGLSWIRVLVAIWSLIVVASITTVCVRSVDEDRILSERFGKEWEEWAKRVAYRLVPFVY